jgi:hypothetical protein
VKQPKSAWAIINRNEEISVHRGELALYTNQVQAELMNYPGEGETVIEVFITPIPKKPKG